MQITKVNLTDIFFELKLIAKGYIELKVVYTELVKERDEIITLLNNYTFFKKTIDKHNINLETILKGKIPKYSPIKPIKILLKELCDLNKNLLILNEYLIFCENINNATYKDFENKLKTELSLVVKTASDSTSCLKLNTELGGLRVRIVDGILKKAIIGYGRHKMMRVYKFKSNKKWYIHS